MNHFFGCQNTDHYLSYVPGIQAKAAILGDFLAEVSSSHRKIIVLLPSGRKRPHRNVNM